MDKKVARLLNVIITAIIVAIGYAAFMFPGFVITLYLLYKYVVKGKAPYFQIFTK